VYRALSNNIIFLIIYNLDKTGFVIDLIAFIKIIITAETAELFCSYIA